MAQERIIDYISGNEVEAKPEEIEAVQPFSKILVEDYNYPKENIITHPQYRVKVRPSDTRREYPVDIAVFNKKTKTDDDVYIIVECKKKTRKDGKTQLEDYLRFSKAKLGVWFNGEEKLCIQKLEKDGAVLFEEIPNIPNYGQRLEDIGLFKRKDLKTTHNLKSVFKSIRNYLAANTVGATRDEVLAQQLINIIFCKIYDERYTEPNDIVTFRSGINEKPLDVKNRILDLFEKVRHKYREVIDSSDEITLDENSIVYIVGELQNYCLIDADRDVVADAFETFIDHALKGGQGQFFTPRNVIKMMIEILDPDEDDFIIDPSCGTGGFLVETLRYIWEKQNKRGKELNWSDKELYDEKMEVALNKICGIDKDYFLSKVAKAYMAILGDGKGGLFCENSLDNPKNWNEKTRIKINKEKFSIILTNPPFGSKIKVQGEDILKQYDFGHKWSLDKKTGEWEKGKIKDEEMPQILFIERDYQLLQNHGKMAIVLPDGVFGNDSFAYVRHWLKEHGQILAIIDVPTETFQPNTSTKTSVLFFEKMKKDEIPNNYDIFMAICETCGHDRRGNETQEDDILNVSKEYRKWKKKH